MRFSFGALRHHLLQDDFVDDIGRFFAEGGMPASRLELRIAERTFASMNASICQSLGRLGVQIVVDEVGRGFASSLDRLARAPIWGLQLDRAWTTALRTDEVALKVCKAGISAAGGARAHADRHGRGRCGAAGGAGGARMPVMGAVTCSVRAPNLTLPL